MSKKLIEQIKSERAHLHDIANQVTIMQGMVGIVERKLGKGEFDIEDIKSKIDKALIASSRLVSIIKERRSKLIIAQEDLEP